MSLKEEKEACFCICHINTANIDCKSCCVGVNQVRDLRDKHKGIGMKEYMKHLEQGCDCK